MKNLVIAAVMIGIMTALPRGAFAQEKTFVGNSLCKGCHNKADRGEQWNKWKASGHARTFELLASPEAKAVAEKLKLGKPATEAPQCLKCHVTAFDEKTGAPVAPLLKEDGVQCESCHGPASLHVSGGKKSKSGDKSPRIMRGDEATCKTCHNAKSPAWKPDRYTGVDGKKTGFDYVQASAKVAHPRHKEKK